MPILSNSKYELFAQAMAQGMSASAAYVAAGYEAHGSNAGRLSKNERVRARVEEIQTAGAEKAGLTISWVLDGLRSNHEQAFRNQDGAVVNRSLELIGKHLGMFKDKVEHSGPGGGPIETETKNELSNLDAEDRDALRAILERRAFKSESGAPGT